MLFGHMGNLVNFLWLGKPRNINYCVFEMKFSLVTNSFRLVTFWSILNRFSGCFVFLLIFIYNCERELIDVEIIKLFREGLSERQSARDNYLQLSTVQWIFDTCSCFLLEYSLPRQRLKGAFKRTAGATRAISATSQQVILVLNFTRPHAITYTRHATYFLTTSKTMSPLTP